MKTWYYVGLVLLVLFFGHACKNNDSSTKTVPVKKFNIVKDITEEDFFGDSEVNRECLKRQESYRDSMACINNILTFDGRHRSYAQNIKYAMEKNPFITSSPFINTLRDTLFNLTKKSLRPSDTTIIIEKFRSIIMDGDYDVSIYQSFDHSFFYYNMDYPEKYWEEEEPYYFEECVLKSIQNQTIDTLLKIAEDHVKHAADFYENAYISVISKIKNDYKVKYYRTSGTLTENSTIPPHIIPANIKPKERKASTRNAYPSFPGDLKAFVTRNMKYPEEAIRHGIEGLVLVECTVEANGKIVRPKILKSAHYLLDQEALRIVGLIPSMKPGLSHGKPVKWDYITIPIRFELPARNDSIKK